MGLHSPAYLEGLTINVYPANTPESPATLLGSASYSSPLILIQIPDGSYLVSASLPTVEATDRTKFGKDLHFASTEGIPVDSYAFIFDPKGQNFLTDGTTVTDVTEKTVTLSKDIPDFLPADTIVTFILDYNLSGNPWTNNALSFTAKTNAVAHKTKTTLPLVSATGIFFGMSVTTAFPGVIADGTTVVAADKTSVTLSKALPQDIASGTKINFTRSLNSGIIQYSDYAGFPIGGFDFYYPASVATAIIPLNAAPPSFFDISVKVTRGTDMNGAELVIVEDIYYNVQAISAPLPATPDQYQFIPAGDTNFYVSLPAPPTNNNAIALTIPSDGTPPPFAALYNAVTAVLESDPTVPPPGKPVPDITALTPDECSQIAYDIVWSQQNLLPAPPDPLEQLYTNPPNSGASKGESGTDEQDRQKFEGDLKSFYATRNAEAKRLATFVSSLSLALSFYKRSQAVTSVRFQFPIIDDNTTLTTIKEAAVLFNNGVDAKNQPLPINPDFTDPGFAVPAEYFYALVLGLPPQSPSQAPQDQQQQMSQAQQQQYHLTCLMNEQQVLDKLNNAISKGIISAPPPAAANPDDPNTPTITVTQAARNLAALGEVEYNDPQCSLNDYSDIQTLVQGWLNVQGEDQDIDTYWRGVVTDAGYLDLVLCLVTNNFKALSDAIKTSAWPLPPPNPSHKTFTVKTVADLTQIQIQDWETFFKSNPDLLPDYTAPGPIKPKPTNPKVIKAQADVFVRNLQSFFQVSAGANPVPSVNPNVPPLLYRDTGYDPIVQFFAAYPGFAFAPTLDPTQPAFQTALDAVFSNDPFASSWLQQTIMAINAVWVLTTGITQAPEPNLTFLPDLRFSVMEALYARGFTSGQGVLNLSLDDFQQALTGTVAYPFAPQIQTNAGTLPQGTSQSGNSQQGGFQPVNSDGCLVNCIPPLYLSPLGPLAYLQEMLKVSATSTCENLQSSDVENTLDAKIARRRGNLGWLQVTEANLETPLPRIDLVNECLEALVATPGSPPEVYSTASDKLDGYILCADDADNDHPGVCHKPATLFETLPEHSSPATSVMNATAYDTLSKDFSAPLLPYAQSLDISRSYLRQLDTSRYEVMRRFREKITEFVLDPTAEPADFQNALWRGPVRIEIAREYLGITHEEYDLLFTQDIVTVPTGNQLLLWQLYGFESETVEDTSWIETIVQVPEFLRRTGLTYCEFVELWKAQCVPFSRAGRDKTFPDCEPCCLDGYVIQFANEDAINDSLKQLAVFIRLWHKLQQVREARYTFTQLCDICTVLGLFENGTINADFIRQLAAFQMLRDHLELRLTDGTDHQTNTTGAERTHLLALWVGTAASKWSWAVAQLLDHVQHYAQMTHGRGNRLPHFIKLITDNLDPLSLLAGFDPTSTTDSWHALPTHTLRFAEVLSKIYASDFSVGELLFLFTAGDHLDGDDPFPLQDENETLNSPLALPDDQDEFSLWALRHKLLAVHVAEEEAERWTWRRIEASLRHEFGYMPTGQSDPLFSLGAHFFPDILESCGHPVNVKQRQYRVNLTNTSADMWNTSAEGPFRYDATAEPPQLWIQVPLKDEEVFERLSHIRQLNPDEQGAVQDLYFSPRADLAPFAFIFSNFGEAIDYLVQEEHERKRWVYFQHEFALCHARCRIIAEHLAHHVAIATSQECPDGTKLAWNLLQHLYADENMATSSWEVDDGSIPTVNWQQPGGGAFAALLGLTGTGLCSEFTPEGSNPIWREVRGPVSAFGREKNCWNVPVPTILPALNLTLSPNQARFADVRNGFALKDQNGESLGGAQGFAVRWQGTLLIEHEGKYEFQAGAPTPDGEHPNFEAAEQHTWRVTLKRGQKSWMVLSHRWPNTQASAAHSAPLMLRRGAYQLTIEFTQPEPHFAPAEVHRQHTGFQLKYSGPDSEHQLVAIPYDHLYRDEKDTTLDDGLVIGDIATHFLKFHFTSTLRDMRRTYQRAFKAVLFAYRFGLSARLIEDYRQSEIGYILAHPDRFEGTSYYRQDGGAGFVSHHAYFDFNLLPLFDTYHAPAYGQDQRVQPLVKRQQALFDWWERIFDYVQVRKESRSAREHPLWLLFEEAAEKQPDYPAHLLRHMGIDLRHAALVTQYYDGFTVSSTDLEDERQAIRVWRAETWLRKLVSRFAVKDIQEARPDLWASDDPGIVEAGEAQSGNANLTHFIYDSCFEHGKPRRYRDVKRLNDGLRERARQALLAYLCGMNWVQMPLPQGGYAQEADDLSALLLLDVEAGLCEKARRVEDAISVVQTYIQRCRLGLEDGFTITPEFIRLWDRRFASIHVWQASKRREIYRENWIDWEAIQQAQNSEAFRFLESELQRTMLTAPRPGGLEYWPEQHIPAHPELALIQSRELDQLRQFTMPSTQPEGFNLLGTQERDARPSWLATISPATVSGGNPNPNPNPNPNAEQDNRDAEENGATTIVVESRQPGSLDTSGGTSQTLPLWIQAAIRLGVPFLRVAAAGEPPASVRFAPGEVEGETCCCCECGKRHPAVVDEYYFWLIESRYYDDFNNPLLPKDTPPPQDATWDWENPDMVPTLLHWDSKPMAQMAWCRVHNGEFQQPRRSVEGVPLDGTTPPALQLLGRADDSLTFTVVGGMEPIGYTGGEQPGFRYDLATDEAVTLPLDVPIPPAKAPTAGTTKYPGGLASYPYFAYFAPGTPLMPPTLFSPALAVGGALRAHCSFEAALKWYALAFNPLQEDCSWCVQDTVTSNTGQPTGVAGATSVTPEGQQVGASNGHTPAKVVVEPVEQLAATTGDAAPAAAIAEFAEQPTGALADNPPGDEGEPVEQVTVRLTDEAETPAGREIVPAAEQTLIVQPGDGEGDGQGDTACCSSTCVSDEVAQNRSIILHYLETLHQWAEALLRRNSPEAVQQARLIVDTEAYILGKRPRSVMGASTDTEHQKEPPIVIRFQPACATLNPRLLALYDLVDDRLALIHDCLDARRLKDGHRERDRAYWGNMELRDGWQTETEPCADEEGGCCPASPYRFMFLLQKAQELASQVKELGSALLAAFEKGDAEYLASLRQLHERQILDLTLEIRRNQWREADWQVQALKKTQEASQARRQYNALLIQSGLISGEVQHQALTDVTLSGQETGRTLEGIGTILGIIPDVNIGTMSFTTISIGSKLQGVFSGMSQIVNSQAGSAGTTGSLRLTQAGWDRREAEWRQQVQVLDIENDQIERQILAAERRRDIALRELNNHQQQMEHAAEMQDFLRDKFTNHALYLYLQQETANLHSRMYELARCTALQAQRAFNYERGHTMRRFLPEEAWDSLHEGLLVGERLQLSLRHMEKAYLDENVREYELTRHFSLRLHFPLEFLRLKATGCCEIDIPEWMFDQLYPGHYMRRVKNVSLTIPCVVGPYTGVHCRLTLLSSRTRIHPRLIPQPVSCCDDDDDCENGYSALPDDPRIVTNYAATEAIATSAAQNDSGMFELNFRDERYLPFEFAGAVSSWRIELPQENNQFDMDTLTDVILHLNYTAREGGEVLRSAANEVAQCHLPGDGWRFFDIRHEFPDAWHRFSRPSADEDAPRRLTLRLGRDAFPFIPGHRDLEIHQLVFFFEAPHAEFGAHQVIEFLTRHGGEHGGHAHGDQDDYEVLTIDCIACDEWPGLYCGVLNIRQGPLSLKGEHELGTFRFPAHMENVFRAFLLCGYDATQKHSAEHLMKVEWRE